jgi:unsaturated chondroitin disaccharide hydrolase
LTRDPVYLEVAQHNADYWLSNVPADGVAPWDFDAPGDGPVDTSASAIAVVGLLKLASHAPSAARQTAYRHCALKTIDSLTSRYLGTGSDGWEGILRGGVYHIHKDLGVNESVMWGEYFFVEALQQSRNVL